MTAATAAERGALASRRLMVDECTVTRVTGKPTSRTTMRVTQATTEIYAGVCRVRPEATQASQVELVERAAFTRRLLVSLPHGTTGVAVDDVVVITTSVDPELVGARLVVRAVDAGTHRTARRLSCEEVSG